MAAPARHAGRSAPWALLRGRGGRTARRQAAPLDPAGLAPVDAAGLAPLDTRTAPPAADPARDAYPRVPAPDAATAPVPGPADVADAPPAAPRPAAAGAGPRRTPGAAIAAAGRGPWAAAATLPTAPAPTPAPLAPLTATLPPALTHYAAPAAAPPHHAPAGYPPAPAAAAPPGPAPAVATGAPAGPAATPPGGAPAPAAPRTSVRDRAWNAGVTGLTFLRRLALALAIGMVAWSLAPVAFGWQTAVVVTGSMHPAVRVGDVVATAPVRSADVSRLPAGSVLLMDDPAKPGTLLLHRLVKVRSDGTLVTKGDANRSRDSTPVPPQNVRGIARLRVPAVGLPVLWARQGEWAPLAAVVLLFGIVVFWQPPRPQRP